MKKPLSVKLNDAAFILACIIVVMAMVHGLSYEVFAWILIASIILCVCLFVLSIGAKLAERKD